MPSIVFALIVAVLTFVAVFSGIVVADYFISSKDNKSGQQEESISKEESNQQESVSKEESTKDDVVQPSTGNSESAKVKCVGSCWSFENGLSYSYKYTYVLNEDGTFTADYNGVSGTKGTFVINDDTISFTGLKETVGPNDIQYATTDYYIASDCSYILYDRSINFKLMRK